MARVMETSSHSPVGPSPTTRPLRSTVMRSLISSISRILWLTNRMAMPRLWMSRTTANSASTSLRVSAVVGSSMIIRRGLDISARAMATSWRPDVGSEPRSASRSSCTPSRAKRLVRHLAHPPPVDQPASLTQLGAERQVLGDRQRRRTARNPGRSPGRRGRWRRSGSMARTLAVDEDLAAIGLVDARDHLDDGRLA